MGKGGSGVEDRLFVTKIPPTVTQEEIASHFERFGTTTDVYLPSAPSRLGHKGIAFISYADPMCVQMAMNSGPHILQGSEVVVDIAAPRGQLPPKYGVAAAPAPTATEATSSERIFVTKVPPELVRDHLAEYFGQFGELTDVYMPAVPGSGTHKGLCFVSYADPSSVQLVLQQPTHEILGHQVVVDVAVARGVQASGKGPASAGKGASSSAYYGGHAQAAPPAAVSSSGGPVPGRLFLTKVSIDITTADLQFYFQQFGDLQDVYIPPNGKGIAFVSFVDPLSSLRALESQQHFVKPGVPVLVDQAFDRPGGGKGAEKGHTAFAQPAYSSHGQGPVVYAANAYGARPVQTRFGPY